MATAFDFVEDAAPSPAQFDFQPDPEVSEPGLSPTQELARARLAHAPLAGQAVSALPDKPFITLPEWPQGEGSLEERISGRVYTSLKNALESVLSPKGAAVTAAVVTAPEVVGPILAATAVKPTLEETVETGKAIARGDVPEAAGRATTAGLNAAMVYGGGRGLVPKSAKILPKAAAEAARTIGEAYRVGPPDLTQVDVEAFPGPANMIRIPEVVEQAQRGGLFRQEALQGAKTVAAPVPKGARPVVPETPPEIERGLTVIQEIRAKGADTKEKIRALFPQLSRETAAKLRNQAFPREKIPDNLSRQDVDRLFLDKLNEESNLEIQQAFQEKAPKPITQVAVTPEPTPRPESPPVAPEAIAPEPTPPAKVEAPAAKEPWQMTRSDLVTMLERRLDDAQKIENEALRDVTVKRISQELESARTWKPVTEERTESEIGKGGSTRKVTRAYTVSDIPKQRRAAVEKALAEGKPVPPEVLADYPDLAPKPAAKEPWQMTSAEYERSVPVPSDFDFDPRTVTLKVSGNRLFNEPMSLESAMAAPALFDKFPFLRDIKVEGGPTQESGHGAYYDPKTKTITVGVFHEVAAENALRHEIQHAIDDHLGRGQREQIAGKVGDWLSKARGDALLEHEDAVRSALAQGKAVPPEVLAQYPDLAPKPAAKPTTAPSQLSPTDKGITPQEKAFRSTAEGQKAMASRASRIAVLNQMNEAIRKVAPKEAYDRALIEQTPDSQIDSMMESLRQDYNRIVAKPAPKPAAETGKEMGVAVEERPLAPKILKPELWDAIEEAKREWAKDPDFYANAEWMKSRKMTLVTAIQNRLSLGTQSAIKEVDALVAGKPNLIDDLASGKKISISKASASYIPNSVMLKLGYEKQARSWVQPKPPETPPTGPGISNGPGAARYGTPGTYSPISELTDRMATAPVKNLREAIGIGERLSDVWARGKDTFTRALGKLRVVPGALKRSWRNVRDLNEVEERVAALDWVLQQSSAKSKIAGETIRKAIPASQVRDAMAIWIDAGGDEAAIRNTLANLPTTTTPRVRRAMEAALTLPDDVKTHASNLADYYARRAQESQAEDVLHGVLEDYFTHVWKKPSNMPDSVKGALNTGRVNEYFQYAHQRKIPTLLEGILQGKEPVLDPAEVIPHYNYLMDRAIASRRFIKSLEDAKMPDGKPILGMWGTRAVIGDPGEGAILIKIRGRPEDYNNYRQIDHPALRKWKWAATDEEGRPVFYEGTLAVHPEAYKRLARMMDRSRLTPAKLTRALLRISGEVKGAKLGLLSPFHQVHLGSHALGHWTNPFFNLREIDWDAPATRFAVEKAGLKLAANPAELANFAEGILSPGLVHKIPIIGPLSKAYSEWLFTDYLPRLKLKTFENAWARNRAFYDKQIISGKITEEQLAMRVGDAINNAYGELNQLWLGKHGRDPRLQRALRLGFLAPDFGEARLRFVGKAFKSYSLEERLALGTLFATLYMGARVGNILTHGDPEIQDWKHAFAVKVGNRWYSMRSVLGDTLHAFSNFPNFLYVRLNPAYARGIMEFFTGRDITGRKRTAGEQVIDELKQVVPIHLGGLTRDDQHIWESFLLSIGLGSQRAAPTAEVSQLASDWRKRRGIESRAETLSDPNSPYRKARIALEFGNRQDFHEAIRELTLQHQARGDRTPRESIGRAFEQYYSRPFSGSARLEPAFKASLGSRERRKYQDALIERRKLLQKFRQWY